MADKIEGLSIGLSLDSVKVDSGLKSLKSKMTLLNSEMKTNLSAFDRGEKSLGKYQTQVDGLNKKLELQKTVTEGARKNYEKMVKEHGEGSVQAEKAATNYNNQAASLNNLERHVDGVTAEMKQFAEAQRISESGWTKFGEKLESVGGKFQKVGGKMKDVGKSMSMYVTAPLVGFAAVAAKTGIDFDDSMAKVQATSGATGADMDSLRKKAKDMGATTKFSASESAEALNYMALAGWDSKQMIDGLDGVMDLAAASGEDLAAVSDIVTDGLSAFGLEAKDSARMADVLAAASSNANTDVAGLGESFKYVAPVAGALGFSIEDTSKAIGLMANAGIKGSQSGTSLRTMMTNLAKPTAAMKKEMERLGISLTDSEGNMKSFDTIMGDLRGAFGDMDEAQQANSAATIFGKEAMSGALAIVNASESDYNKLGDAINNSGGAAKKMADIMEGELGGTLREIKSGLEGFAISIYEQMLPSLEKVADKVKGFVGWLNDLSPAAKKTAVVIGTIAAAIGPLLVGFGTAAIVIGNVMTAVAPLTAAIAGAGGLAASFATVGGAILTFATGPIGIGIAALVGVTAATIGIVNHMKKDAIPEIDRFGDSVSDSTKKALGGFFELSDGASDALADITINSTKLTKEMATELADQYRAMNAEILDGMKTRHTDQIKEMETFFANSSALTSEKEEEILRKEKVRNQARETEQKGYEERISKILRAAAVENRELTENEKDQINAIQQTMNENAVQYLTDNERDQKVILENMKNQASDISARQAAEVTKNSAKARDKVIGDADAQYNETVAFAIQQRDENGTISADEANDIIREAKKKRDESVKHAENTHKDVVKEAKAQAKDHVNEVDWETGEIKSKWEIYKTDVGKRVKDSGEEIKTAFSDMWKSVTGGTKTGTKFVKDKWNESTTSVKNFAEDMRKGASEKVESLRKAVVDKSSNLASTAIKKWEGMKTSVVNLVSDMKTKAQEKFDDIVAGAKALPGRMKDGIVSMANSAVDGIKSVGQKMANKFGSVVNGIIGGLNTVTGKLGIKATISKWTVPQFAKGTDGHKGGPMIVGDKHGREIVELPNGKSFLSPDTDTLLNAPKGTRVIPNNITEQYLKGDIPEFAKGTGVMGWLKDKATGFKNAMSNVWDYAKNPSKLLDLMPLPSLGDTTGGIGTIVKGAVGSIKDKAIDFIKNAFTQSDGELGAKGGFPSPFRLTSRAGWRIHPITRKRKFHYGDDWGAPQGTRIPSRGNGRVVHTGFHSALGNYVDVKSGDYKLRYQHNMRNLVSKGDMVKNGQTLGLVGSTGHSTGPHLHFETRKNGNFVPPKSLGFASGGYVGKSGMYNLAEEGHGEFVIPTAPSRRTDAMKLLALAGKSIGGGNKRPNQLSNSGSGVFEKMLGALIEQSQMQAEQIALLTKLVLKDTNLYVDGNELGQAVAGGASRGMNDMTNIKNLVRGY